MTYLGISVTLLAWMAQRTLSSNKVTRKASAASWTFVDNPHLWRLHVGFVFTWRHMMAVDWNLRSLVEQRDWAISRITREKGICRINLIFIQTIRIIGFDMQLQIPLEWEDLYFSDNVGSPSELWYLACTSFYQGSLGCQASFGFWEPFHQ